MITIFNEKTEKTKSEIDIILQNNDDYKTLSKVAYKKHQPIIYQKSN